MSCGPLSPIDAVLGTLKVVERTTIPTTSLWPSAGSKISSPPVKTRVQLFATFASRAQMRMLAAGVSQYSRDGIIESESEMEERQRLFWEDIEEDFIARYCKPACFPALTCSAQNHSSPVKRFHPSQKYQVRTRVKGIAYVDLLLTLIPKHPSNETPYFFDAPHACARLQEDAARRQASLKSRSTALYQDWTFQPTLSPASQRVVGESAWAGACAAGKVGHKCVRSRMETRGVFCPE